jgi:O-antigen ligase
VRDNSKLMVLLIVPVAMAAMFAFAEMRPGFFNNETILAALVGMQFLLFVVWHYDKLFFPSMMLVFLWSGSDLPLSGIWTVGRWVLLIVGAFVGSVKWLKHAHRRPLTALHLVAALCILAAAVSAEASNRMLVSLLKTLSLALLFLYGAAGARVALLDRESAFFRGLIKVCEVLTWFSAVVYVGLHFDLLGNTNSLGAILAVVIIPVLLWGVLSAEDYALRHRLTISLLAAWALLVYSVARAGLIAATVVCTLMCLCSRRGKILLQGAFVTVLLVTMLAVVRPEQFSELTDSFTEDVIYKGQREGGLLGSRKSPWEDTQKVIRDSPWFGSGFGTDFVTGPVAAPDSLFSSTSDTTREHGSSYLTLLQYVGTLGSVPFLGLFVLILTYIRRVCLRMWRTGDVSDYAIPLAFICLAGLINAAFEDWLVAAGYYLNVFFWTSAFLLADFQRPAPSQWAAPQPVRQPSFVPASR